jgi:hypothetical protein
MSIRCPKIFSIKSTKKDLHMVGSSNLYESFYKILTHILPYISNKRCDSDRIFYKKATDIFEDLMRIKSGFWAKILQKKDFGIWRSRGLCQPTSKPKYQRKRIEIDLRDDGLDMIRRHLIP